MRFKRRISYDYSIASITFIPLINLLCLLFFFSAVQCGLFAQPGGVPVRLPSLLTSDVLRRDHIRLTLSADAQLYYANDRISLSDLSRFLKLVGPRDPAVLIQAHKKTPLEIIARVWDICRKAGITGVSLVTEP
ncbi:MAG TPA: biopolymer transporter ExbD [Candidatus Omnitrophota bacterium]|nr:biopolymer transporter ExbD [Candidatus Omnitrophota bacterium]HRZ15387.1 biopolymer transporter ExbD [Candidatus Omnitrophota bacterium]